MKTTWMLWMVVAALAMVATGASAQERPAAPPAGIDQERPLPPADGMGEADGVDGLGLLLMDAEGEAAQAPGAPGMRGRMARGPQRGRLADLHKQLNLTDEQKTKIADVHDKTERATIPIQGNLEIAHLDLRKLMRAEKPDAKAIDAQIDRIAGLRASLQKTHVAGMLEVRGLLTPAQQKTLRESGLGLMMGRGMHGGPRMRGGRAMRM